MAVDAAFGRFATPSGTGATQVVSSLSFQPECYILWGVPVTSESIAVHAANWVGMTDGTNEFVIMVADENGATDTRRDINESAVLSILNADSDTPVAVATHSAFDSDGFSLNFSSTTVDYQVHWMAFGGLNDVTVGSVAASGSPVTGLGFQPDFLFSFNAGLALAGSASQHAIHAAMGVADGTNEWWIGSFNGADGSDQNTKTSLLRTSGFTGQLYQANLTWEASLTSFDTGGFTWSGSNADGFYYMAMDTGGSMSCNDFTKATGAAPAAQDLPAAGFTPGMYLLASGNEADETPAADGSHVSMGITDGSVEQHTFRTTPNNTQNSDQRQDNDNLLMMGRVSDAAPAATATASTITDSTPTITWDPNNGTAYIIGVWYVDVLVPITRDQDGFRYYDDDAAPGSETALAAEDTNVGSRNQEDAFHIRIQTDMAGGDPPAEGQKIQYKEVSDATTEWRDVPI